MTNEQILRKAIEKAVKGEWYELRFRTLFYGRGKAAGVYKTYKDCNAIPYEVIIFSHDFAKAFWGEGKMPNVEIGDVTFVSSDTFRWQHHLQQMVLEKKPLLYLERFIK